MTDLPTSITRSLAVILATALLTACGGGEKKNASIEDRTKAAIEKMIALVNDGNYEAFTAMTVYRGDDKARKWKDVNDYSVDTEKATADRYFSKIKKSLAAGKPAFDKFESDTESEGTWLVWHVKFGDGDAVAFACLEIDGKIALGDMD